MPGPGGWKRNHEAGCTRRVFSEFLSKRRYKSDCHSVEEQLHSACPECACGRFPLATSCKSAGSASCKHYTAAAAAPPCIGSFDCSCARPNSWRPWGDVRHRFSGGDSMRVWGCRGVKATAKNQSPGGPPNGSLSQHKGRFTFGKFC